MTREQVQERLAAYLAAEAACLSGQSYRIGDRELRRADLAEIRRAIDELSDELAVLEGRRIRRARVTFV